MRFGLISPFVAGWAWDAQIATQFDESNDSNSGPEHDSNDHIAWPSWNSLPLLI